MRLARCSLLVLALAALQSACGGASAPPASPDGGTASSGLEYNGAVKIVRAAP